MPGLLNRYTAIASAATNARRPASVRHCRFCPDWATNVDEEGETAGRTDSGDASDRGRAAELLDETGRETQAFSDALEKFKALNRRRVVSCEETLAIFKSLGYRKEERTTRATARFYGEDAGV